MEKGIKAAFYKFKYYIFPEEFNDFSKITHGTVIKAKRLNEELCMAPDFIYESITEESVEIDNPALLFPVEVNLYSGKEYDEILEKQVDRVCPGCLRYDPTGEGLHGHHREISLCGTCYEREDNNKIAPYGTRAFWFYCGLAEHLDELAECIEKGKAARFNKICNGCADYIYSPAKFFGEKRGGKYFIYMHCPDYTDLYLNLIAYTALCAETEENPLKKAGWSVIPFVPAGANVFKGKIKETAPIAYLTQSKVPWRTCINIPVSRALSQKQHGKAVDELSLYLSCKVGGDVFLRTVDAVQTVTEGSPNLLTAQELCEKLRGLNKGQPQVFPPAFPYGWENAQTPTPYRGYSDGFSHCIDLAGLAYDSDYADVPFNNEFAWGYLYIPMSGADAEAAVETVNYYLDREEEVPEPISIKEDFAPSFMRTGACECAGQDGAAGGGWAIDLLITDEKMFYKFLKILAPVLSAYNVRAVIINGDGVQEYVCGAEIIPASSENGDLN